jgi:AcrR family transcriptional regulator
MSPAPAAAHALSMTRNDPPAPGTPGEATASWRAQAVARSLDPARTRAEFRVQRFLDAALELTRGSRGKEFTVQEVVERSGQSLRSFYQHFAGKHELLLALFEESMHSAAGRLRDVVASEQDPLERLHRFTVEYYLLCRPVRDVASGQRGPDPVLSEFAQQLLLAHPDEAARAFMPLVSLVEELIDATAEAGVLRPGLDHRRLGGVLLQVAAFNAFASTISSQPVRADGVDSAEAVWELVLHGMGISP